jgi:hypothetical protein
MRSSTIADDHAAAVERARSSLPVAAVDEQHRALRQYGSRRAPLRWRARRAGRDRAEIDDPVIVGLALERTTREAGLQSTITRSRPSMGRFFAGAVGGHV